MGIERHQMRNHSVKTRLVSLSAALAVLASLALASPVRADHVSLRPLPGRSIYPLGCPHPTPYKDAQAEFSLAVDPRRPSRLTTAWIQGDLGSVMSGYSRNGGLSFKPVIVSGLQRCTGGRFAASTDPSVSEGPDETTYLSTDPSPDLQESYDVWVSRSHNQGRTWLRPVVVDHHSPASEVTVDQEAITADPYQPGHAYIVWAERAKRPVPGGKTSATPELFFSRTSDGGDRWSRPRPLAEEPPTLGAAAGRIVVPTPGVVECIYTVQVVYNGIFVPKYGKATWFMAIRSADGGLTWGRPRRIGTTLTAQPTDPVDRDHLVRAMAAHDFGAAADRSGHVYVVWADIRHSFSRLRLAVSSNAGRSWRRPRDLTGTAVEPLFPAVAIEPGGTVGITFYDWRNYRPGGSELTTDVWFRRSTDAGRSWHETRIGGPFDLRTAPLIPGGLDLPGYFLGEYQGLVGVPGGFVATFAQARPQARVGGAQGFAARIRVTAKR
jgi:hypothetical protein